MIIWSGIQKYLIVICHFTLILKPVNDDGQWVENLINWNGMSQE